MQKIKQNETSITRAFGEKMRTWRQAQGLSQEELSHRTNLNTNSIGVAERGESSPSLETANMIAQGLGFRDLAEFLMAPLPEKHPLLDTVPKKAQYSTHLPVYSIEAACGYFSEQAEPAECLGWVEVEYSHIRRKLHGEMFVVRAKGKSMEPYIHDGDLCVFELYTPTRGGSKDGRVMLFDLHHYCNPDDGSSCVIKEYHSVWAIDEDGNRYLKQITLHPFNPAFHDATYSAEDLADGAIQAIGFFICTL